MKKAFRWVGITLGFIGGILLFAIIGMYLNSARQLNQTYEITGEKIAIPIDEQSIANGKKWVEAICSSCHGADLSGTTMVDDPAIGRVDAANLTSGNGGIGSSYTDEDWVRAIRHGVAQDGTPLVIMPSSAFWNFNDKDLGEVIAYLKTLPPVDHQTRVELAFVGTMVLPNDPTVLHVKLIDHNNRPAAPILGVTPEYGHYLVNTSGCRECHGDDLSGKVASNGRPAAPNLTLGGELQVWSAGDFIQTIRTGVAPSGRALEPDEMPWKEYSHYSDDELTAIYLYLQSLSALAFDNQ